MSSPTPAALVATREALHALALHVISPVRQRATGGRIALQARPGGFGTQELPGGGWAGALGTRLVSVDAAGKQRDAPITSLRGAAAFYDAPDAETLADDDLPIDAAAVAVLADAFAGGTQALTELIAIAAEGDDPSGIDLWPEHFDVAITLGAEATAQRATYGVSPGDEHHPAPYVYVAPWQAPTERAGWDATGFVGAEQPYTTPEAAFGFFLDRRRALR